MNVPEEIKIRNTMHGSGAKGMAIYGYEDCHGLGIRMEARRKDGRSPFVETWFLDALPGHEFATFAELREKALPLTDEQIKAETADKYPLIAKMGPDSCGNACRLCPRPPYVPGPRAHHETWSVQVAYSWKDCHSVSLCDTHMEQFGLDGATHDVKALVAALEAEVAERRARAAARGNPW